MTVKELRERLAEHPDTMLVVVDGYEDGYDDPKVHTVVLCDEQGEGKKRVGWAGRYNVPLGGEVKIEAVVVARG